MSLRRIAITAPGALALAACASVPDAEYPSLAIRDAERATLGFEQPTGDCAVPAEPVVPVVVAPPPPPVSDAILAQVARWRAQARDAHADFERALSETRAAVRGSGSVGSKSWGRAQVAYANLRSIRARTAVPLADLDTLVATRRVAGEPVEPIVAARDEVAALIEQEDAALAELAPAL